MQEIEKCKHFIEIVDKNEDGWEVLNRGRNWRFNRMEKKGFLFCMEEISLCKRFSED